MSPLIYGLVNYDSIESKTRNQITTIFELLTCIPRFTPKMDLTDCTEKINTQSFENEAQTRKDLELIDLMHHQIPGDNEHHTGDYSQHEAKRLKMAYDEIIKSRPVGQGICIDHHELNGSPSSGKESTSITDKKTNPAYETIKTYQISNYLINTHEHERYNYHTRHMYGKIHTEQSPILQELNRQEPHRKSNLSMPKSLLSNKRSRVLIDLNSALYQKMKKIKNTQTKAFAEKLNVLRNTQVNHKTEDETIFLMAMINFIENNNPESNPVSFTQQKVFQKLRLAMVVSGRRARYHHRINLTALMYISDDRLNYNQKHKNHSHTSTGNRLNSSSADSNNNNNNNNDKKLPDSSVKVSYQCFPMMGSIWIKLLSLLSNNAINGGTSNGLVSENNYLLMKLYNSFEWFLIFIVKSAQDRTYVYQKDLMGYAIVSFYNYCHHWSEIVIKQWKCKVHFRFLSFLEKKLMSKLNVMSLNTFFGCTYSMEELNAFNVRFNQDIMGYASFKYHLSSLDWIYTMSSVWNENQMELHQTLPSMVSHLIHYLFRTDQGFINYPLTLEYHSPFYSVCNFPLDIKNPYVVHQKTQDNQSSSSPSSSSPASQECDYKPFFDLKLAPKYHHPHLNHNDPIICSTERLKSFHEENVFTPCVPSHSFVNQVEPLTNQTNKESYQRRPKSKTNTVGVVNLDHPFQKMNSDPEYLFSLQGDREQYRIVSICNTMHDLDNLVLMSLHFLVETIHKNLNRVESKRASQCFPLSGESALNMNWIHPDLFMEQSEFALRQILRDPSHSFKQTQNLADLIVRTLLIRVLKISVSHNTSCSKSPNLHLLLQCFVTPFQLGQYTFYQSLVSDFPVALTNESELSSLGPSDLSKFKKCSLRFPYKITDHNGVLVPRPLLDIIFTDQTHGQQYYLMHTLFMHLMIMISSSSSSSSSPESYPINCHKNYTARFFSEPEIMVYPRSFSLHLKPSKVTFPRFHQTFPPFPIHPNQQHPFFATDNPDSNTTTTTTTTTTTATSITTITTTTTVVTSPTSNHIQEPTHVESFPIQNESPAATTDMHVNEMINEPQSFPNNCDVAGSIDLSFLGIGHYENTEINTITESTPFESVQTDDDICAFPVESFLDFNMLSPLGGIDAFE